MSRREALESCGVPIQLPIFLFDNPALEHTKIQPEMSMSSRSRKQIARKIGRGIGISLRDSIRRTSRQRRKQQSVASPALHHSVYNL
ncbi:hypothetical protein AVEN_63022-1 [Araneus ventricosus]|uniref:Uncharacterized protein n=1 Tax=Araneus ventricosus TaxID=182803 RepID=A0A4Y2CSX6_ARAVE|nr:hypothetical protein AVEN_63022-1 [Araneus ventricosus]